MLDNISSIHAIAEKARIAAQRLANSTYAERKAALLSAASHLRRSEGELLAANAKDLASFDQSQQVGKAFRDRLLLNKERIEAMAEGLEAIAEQPDPLHVILETHTRPNGLVIEKISVPIGVIGIIYESRPNVTADAGGLCILSGNAAILRGGSESQYSSAIILKCLQRGLMEAGLPPDSIQFPLDYDRARVGEMLRMQGMIDLIIPRGGKGLIARVMEESKIPILAHLEGNNHTYIHTSADPGKARKILLNAKMRRPGVCGATETLLIDRTALLMLQPILSDLKEAGCEIRGDQNIQALDPGIIPATEEDWATEYLEAILAIKTVSSFTEALEHIATYGSRHTEAIIAEDPKAIEQFFQWVDAAILLANASTQFADGGEFGMGAEIGIATGKLHARGPVGARELTIHKYLVRGTGQIRH